MDKFWERVKNLIKSHKITQEKFVDYIGIPRSTFYDWLRLEMVPDVITAYNIATALGVSLEYLLTGVDRKSEEERMRQTEERKTTEAQVKKLVGKLQEEIVKF